ncbi:MAG TPA: HEAT repeat domain-containing protein [Candidatus Polarisedimenticolaceae bacterium]
MRRLPTATTLLLLATAASAAPLDLYDWMGPAPIVVVAEVVTSDSRFVELRVERVLRGGLEPGSVIQVDLRDANRDREAGTAGLDLEDDRRYLVLLQPSTERRAVKAGAFALTRGTAGARPVPLETGAALETAAVRLAEIQNRKDLDAAWKAMSGLLLDPNPFLSETALDQHLKFRRGDPTLLAPARTLLSSPAPAVRSRAAALAALVLARGGVPEDTEAATVADLTAAARRDPDPAVREAATTALGASVRDEVVELLRAIARDDPDQRVRYAAVRVLFERSVRGERAD